MRAGRIARILWRSGAALMLSAGLLVPRGGAAQEVRIRDLTTADNEVPVRLVGYGLVVGLDGTGDRAMGGYGATHTVRSVVNLLRNFGIEVPQSMLRTRNVAAVLVTAEASPYLRPGGRFDVQVASVGDAVSLRGGVLWTTPLVAEVGGEVLATAQGPLVMSDGGMLRAMATVETTARVPDGGLLVAALPRPDFAAASRLLLREPNLGTAVRIAEAINGALGPGTAVVEDPGSVALRLEDGADRAALLARIGELRVLPDRRAQVVIDGRDGTVVTGGGLVVGEAVVSHGTMTLTVAAGEAPGGEVEGSVRVAPGTTVQDVAAALHAVGAPPSSIAAIFEALRSVGALAAEVIVR
ncbi:MAG TPA: flagellar basal body P-ring protein FlgI [Longimicrobiales bacterium]|jgi:flagellar P-ring protein precursor FlgI